MIPRIGRKLRSIPRFVWGVLLLMLFGLVTDLFTDIVGSVVVVVILVVPALVLPAIGAVSFYFGISSNEPPLAWRILDWLTKPFRISESLMSICEQIVQ